ncbi:MAG: hypothetical protein GIX03_13185 [Candidatus Eremiobacteraeota bacterium]|nr:hypothetical protein [Candidatus Eremiobacteraeota bacterium]MBC5803919.1 hypothetical protein [Candidatus Eremiobacteraeota bacterium]MBC5824581.1 hypothetical protein [Candidatus Eremiobacteraeota bacterium]
MIVGVAHLVARKDVHNSKFTDSSSPPSVRRERVGKVLHVHEVASQQCGSGVGVNAEVVHKTYHGCDTIESVVQRRLAADP